MEWFQKIKEERALARGRKVRRFGSLETLEERFSGHPEMVVFIEQIDEEKEEREGENNGLMEE